MAEQMTESQIIFQEIQNTGTAWTRNAFMEDNGYLVIRDLWDPKELYCPVPEKEGNLPIIVKTQKNLTMNH